MFSYIIILLLLLVLSFVMYQFHKYKKIVNVELKFYENRLEEEESSKKEVIAEYESKKHLLENPHPEDFNVENKDIKKDLDQRTDQIYDYLNKISHQIDYLHYHQLNIPKIESKRSKLETLNLEEHHNYIEYILQSHNIKSEINYFSHSLIAPEVKILPFAFFITRSDKNIIIDTKLLQFVREFKNRNENQDNKESKDIITEKLTKYFKLISNDKYLKNIQSYFVKKDIINHDKEIIILSIVPTISELNIVKDYYSDEDSQYYHLIDSSNLYKFL